MSHNLSLLAKPEPLVEASRVSVPTLSLVQAENSGNGAFISFQAKYTAVVPGEQIIIIQQGTDDDCSPSEAVQTHRCH